MHEYGVTRQSSLHADRHEPWWESSLLLDRIKPWQRWEWWVLIGLFALTLATRWPLRITSLEEWDTANYALAVREFDVLKHQPQPPGYLFFIGAARFAQIWIPDPIEALTAVQIISGALTIVLFYGLLRLSMPPLWALASTLLLLFSAQVWFQHVRPMEDAFAFLWLLGVTYAFVRSLGGDARWWLGGMVGLGLAMGAKQLLPAFLVGIWGRALWDFMRHRQFHIIVLGILGTLIASLSWFIPLSLHVGTAPAYVAAAMSQLAWGREHDALLFNWSPDRLAAQWHTTMVLIWGPRALALPMWSLVAVGTWQVLRRYPLLRWLLWLLVPTLLLRFFFLGYWPRFAIYYLPFLLPLAVIGFVTLLRTVVRLTARIKSSSTQNVYASVQPRAPLWLMIPSLALLVGWIVWQTAHIVPSLLLLHREPSPVVQAMEFIRQHYNPTTTLIMADSVLISRHLDYYGAGDGFSHVYEPDLRVSTTQWPQGMDHVLKIRVKPVPPPSGHHLASWSLKIPRWEDLSPFDDFSHVALYEIRGPLIVFNEWQGPEVHGMRVMRWSKSEGNQIWVFRVPPQGSFMRLQGEIPTLPGMSSPPPVTIHVNGDPVYTAAYKEVDVSFRVYPRETTKDLALIEIQPGCVFVPAEIMQSDDTRRLGCFRLTDLTIHP